ncbi:MAG: hypothetical protein IKE21_08050 [Erysipelotrichaceae bacterium]|nr:hypothetical protein [Erysipelotrichaceae bacterium]
MKKFLNESVKEGAVLYCAIYTVTTILNSIGYLLQGIHHDPNGNWHELTRAAVVLIGVLAYELALHLPVRNMLLRAVIVYALTMPLVLLTVWLSSFIDPLSPGAYTDITINYTGLFLLVSLIALIVVRLRKEQRK